MIPDTKVARTYNKLVSSFDWSAPYEQQIENMQIIIDYLLSLEGHDVLFDWQYTDIMGHKSVTTVNDKLDDITRRLTSSKRMLGAV